jgi:tetratricopeptide (TPR) repeat protein
MVAVADSVDRDLLASLKQLREARSYTRLERLCGEELKKKHSPEVVEKLHDARAWVRYETGRYLEAAHDLEAVADLLEAGVAERADVAWARARALESRWRARDGAKQRNKVVLELDGAIKDPKRTAVERAAFRWARARTLSGPHPDQRPKLEDLLQADQYLKAAAADAPRNARILLTRVRVHRMQIRRPETRRERDLQQARELLEECRTKLEAPSDMRAEQAQIMIDYEQARLALAESDIGQAREALNRVLHADPGHQAANVWMIYVRRSGPPEKEEDAPPPDLLGDIDDLFRNPALRRGAGPDGPEGPVVAPDLEAELLTERAVLLEQALDLDGACKDYTSALDESRRPEMSFAQRGLFRCHVKQGRYEVAAAEKTSIDGDSELGADVYAELGTLPLYLERYDEALEYFEAALRADLDYGPAYAYEISARRRMRSKEGIDHAIARAEKALSERSSSLFLPNTVRLAIADAQLSLANLREAGPNLESYFSAAANDQLAEVSQDGWAGLIALHRVARRFDTASKEAKAAPPGPRVCAAAGWLHGDLGEFDKALAEFEQGLAHSPHDVDCLVGKARVLRLMGRVTEARDHAAHAIAELPPHLQGPLKTEHGWASVDLSKPKEAEKVLKDQSDAGALRVRVAAACSRSAPGSELTALQDAGLEQLQGRTDLCAPVLHEVGRCALGSGDPLAATHCFEKAKRGSRSLLLRLSQGECFLAHRAFSDAVGATEEAETMEGGRYKHDPAVHSLRARCLFAAGDARGAVSEFKWVLDRWPAAEPIAIGHSVALFGGGDQKAACAELRELRAASPKNLKAAEQLAWLLVSAHEQGYDAGSPDDDELAEATNLCRQVLEDEPAAVGVYRCLAAIARNRGRLPQAELYLRHAGQLDPRDADVLCDKGHVLGRLHHYPAAEASLRDALKIDPANGRVHFVLGTIHLDRGWPLKAATCFKESAALMPSEPMTHTALATALLGAKRGREALAAVDDGLNEVPDHRQLELQLAKARALHGLATGEAEDGRDALLAEAWSGLDSADGLARLSTEKSQVRYHRGMIRNAQGSQGRARREFRRALRLDPTSVDARRASALMPSRSVDPSERLAQRVGYVLAGIGLLFVFGAVTLGIVEAAANKSADLFDPRWFPVVGALLAVILLGGLLPRLAGLKLRGMLELSVAPLATVTERPQVRLDFRDVPLVLMAGPAPYQASDPMTDTYDAYSA